MIAAKEYIHVPTIGQANQCLSAIKTTTQKLNEEYEQLALQGYVCLFINSEKEIEENLIFSDYKRHTNDRFPFIYAMVQPSGDKNDIDSFMKALGYSPVTPGYIDDQPA